MRSAAVGTRAALLRWAALQPRRAFCGAAFQASEAVSSQVQDSREELENSLVKHLKAQLKEAGLVQKGNKPQLVERLLLARHPEAFPEVAAGEKADLDSGGRATSSAGAEVDPVLKLQSIMAEARIDPDAPPEKQYIEEVQDFVETVLKIDQGLLKGVWDITDREFRAVVRGRGQELDKSRTDRQAKRILKFFERIEMLLHRRLDGTRHAADKERLGKLIRPCHASIELFHNALWAACFGEEKPMSIVASEAAQQEESVPETPRAGGQTAPIDTQYMWKFGSESRPLSKRMTLDVKVTWTDPPVASSPSADKSILLSNLPLDATEEVVRGALSPCGPVRSVQMCPEWLDIMRPPSSDAAAPAAGSTSEGPEYSPLYAIVEFEDDEGRNNACRQALGLFGILMKEVLVKQPKASSDPEAKPKRPTKKVVTRPAFPQDANLKRTLLLQGLRWRLELWELLAHISLALAEGDRGPCSLRALNSSGLANADVRIDSLEVESDGRLNEVRQVPDHISMIRLGGGVGLASLRFASFEQAFAARKLLKGLDMGGRPLECGFAPWRPTCREKDSFGKALEEPVLTDLALAGRSSQYNLPEDDPLRWFSTPVQDPSDDAFGGLVL